MRHAPLSAPLSSATSDPDTVARLSELRPGQRGRVVRIDRDDAGRLRKLLALGVLPGVEIALQQASPAFVLRVGRTQLAIDARLASAIHVRLRR